MPTDRKQYVPLNPPMMARVCRKLAADLRREAGLGMGPIRVNGEWVPRGVAAVSADRQAQRWEDEIRTGVENRRDREMIGW